jgi:hypothetical protein
MSASRQSVATAHEVKPDPKVLPAVKFLNDFTDLVKRKGSYTTMVSLETRSARHNLCMTADDLAESLRADRLTWEQHGVLPGEERLGLYVDRVDLGAIHDADLVFLWASWAIVTNANDDEENLERQIILGEITEDVASAAVPVGSLVDEVGERSLEHIQRALLGGAFALEDGTTIHIERDVLEDGRRLLLCRADRQNADGIEGVVISGGGCQIRSFPEGSPQRRLPLT